MLVAWDPIRWWDQCMPENDQEPILTDKKQYKVVKQQ